MYSNTLVEKKKFPFFLGVMEVQDASVEQKKY